MDQRDRLPQIEVAVGDSGHRAGAAAPGAADRRPMLTRLRDFATAHGVQWWLQPKGPDTVHRLDEGGAGAGRTRCPSSASRCRSSRPTSPRSTRTSTACWCRARCGCSTCSADERVIDWFCGLGNFTLPIATQAREVLGIEGSEALVQRSRENAARNGLATTTRFEARNLFEMTAGRPGRLRRGRQVAGRSAARRRLRAGQGAGRTARRLPRSRRAGRRRSASST